MVIPSVPPFMKNLFFLCVAAALLPAAGCLNVKTAPIEVKPIHITVDVNVKVERELKSVFSDLDATDPTLVKSPNPSKP